MWLARSRPQRKRRLFRLVQERERERAPQPLIGSVNTGANFSALVVVTSFDYAVINVSVADGGIVTSFGASHFDGRERLFKSRLMIKYYDT